MGRASGCEASLADNVGVTLATFDGAAGTSFKFTELNDPVMGGKSTGTWKVDATEKVGIFDGEVVNVPSLKAPGFIKAAADAKYFPDASSAASGDVVLSVRTSTPEYKGYRITLVSGAVSPSFACAGGGALPLSRGCYKAKFSVPKSTANEFQQVKIPLKDFSDLWSSATGEHTKECADDSSACLTAQKLSKIQRVEVWAEGADGKIHLEVQKISVEPASYIVVCEIRRARSRFEFLFLQFSVRHMSLPVAFPFELCTHSSTLQRLLFDLRFSFKPDSHASMFLVMLFDVLAAQIS